MQNCRHNFDVHGSPHVFRGRCAGGPWANVKHATHCRITQITTQISFAPTAVSKRVIPRSWERIPSMAFLARHRSRRIWKRFRQSMEALRGRTGVVTGQIEETELVNEISASANAGYMRGVKRQCLGMDRGCDSESRPTRSFLETKWELEAGQRKRE